MKVMERKAYTAFGETGFGKTGFDETGRHHRWAYSMEVI